MSSWFLFDTSLPSTVSRRSPHSTFGVVLGKVGGGVSSDAVDGKVHNIGEIHTLIPPCNENYLANSIDPNYLVTFSVNSVDPHLCRIAACVNLFQDGTSRTNN